MAKTITTHILAFIAGAVLLYMFLWYQVFTNLHQTVCQTFTGNMSAEVKESCK